MKENFIDKARSIKLLHFQQQESHIENLNNKYKKEILGSVNLWPMIEKLSLVIDPTDKELACVSQWVHTLQVIEAMEKDKVSEELFVVGWLHDIGKLLLLYNERPENVVCDNSIVKHQGVGCGLDNCILHWNHDEFAYLKFKDHISYDMSWLIRYHSIKLDECKPYMNDKDLSYYDKYISFRRYDKRTKSIYHIPNIDIDKHRKIIEKWFPNKIEF